MALAEPLFTSQLYRENANVNTRICTSHSLILSIAPLAPHDNRFFPSAPDFHPSSPSARNFVHKLFYDKIPPDWTRLHFSDSFLRPINSISNFDVVLHI